MSTQSRDQNRTERAAAVRAVQARKERNRRIGLIVGIVVILGAIVAAGTWYSGGGSSKPPSNVKVAVTAGPGSILVGKASAPVKVVIYEDFLCPYCRELEDSTRDFLRESAASGKVQVEYRPINLLTDYSYSARSLNAWAAVLENASPQAALKLHDLFYENQPYETDSDNTTDADIAALVKKAGGENAAVTAAMKTQDTDFFAAAQQAMVAAKVQGTPTVYVNGHEMTGAGIPDLVSRIEKAVADGS